MVKHVKPPYIQQTRNKSVIFPLFNKTDQKGISGFFKSRVQGKESAQRFDSESICPRLTFMKPHNKFRDSFTFFPSGLNCETC